MPACGEEIYSGAERDATSPARRLFKSLIGSSGGPGPLHTHAWVAVFISFIQICITTVEECDPGSSHPAHPTRGAREDSGGKVRDSSVQVNSDWSEGNQNALRGYQGGARSHNCHSDFPLYAVILGEQASNAEAD